MPAAQTLPPAERPSVQRLIELVDAMQGQPVVLAADLVADRFLTGVPKRISREAPVLILGLESDRVVPGGGANAVANVAALGGIPFALGAVGDDASGAHLLEALTARGVSTAGVLVREGWKTTTKTRILGGGRHAIKQQIVRLDIEEPRSLGDGEREELLRRLEQWRDAQRHPVTTAVISDYGYGAAEPDLLAALRQRMGDGARILVDSRYRLGEFRGLSGATPNEEEAEKLWGSPLGEDGKAAVQALRQRLGADFLLVTRGSHGMELGVPEGAAGIAVHGTDQVADVTGAGDTVIGTFALALAAGGSPLEAALLANYAGGIVVMKMGTATLSPEELRDAIRKDPLPLEALRWVSS